MPPKIFPRNSRGGLYAARVIDLSSILGTGAVPRRTTEHIPNA